MSETIRQFFWTYRNLYYRWDGRKLECRSMVGPWLDSSLTFKYICKVGTACHNPDLV